MGGSASQGGTGGGAGGGGGTNAGGATATGGVGGQAGALGGVGNSGTGGGAGGTGGSGGSTGASLVTLANAFCATARSCCVKSGISASLGDCETLFPSRLHALAFVNKGTVKIDSTALAACIAAYNQAATTCAYHSLVAACKGVFVGTKAENEPCGVGGSNASGVYECQKSDGPEKCTWTGDPSNPAVTGVCHKLVHGKNGDPCDSSCASGEECSVDAFGSSSLNMAMCFEDDGLYCGFGASGDACAPIVAQGKSCAADYPAGPFSVLGSCASTSFCEPAALKCKAASTIGQSCSSLDSACLRGLTCAEDGKCADLGFASWFTCEGEPPAP